MTFKKTLATVSFIGMAAIAAAQQLAPFASNYNQPILTNPAYTGYYETAQAFFLFRKQWAALPDSPETAVLNIDGKLTDKMGLGFMLMNDRQNILGRTGGYLSYRYSVKVSDDQQLNFGIQAGAFQNSILFDQVNATDPSDEALLINAQSRLAPDVNVGLMWNWKKLELGLSSFQVLGNAIVHENQSQFKEGRFNLIRHFNASARYSFELNDKWSIDPMLVLRSVQGLPIQGDIAVFANMSNVFFGGLGYRYNNAAFAQIGMKLYEQINLSYVAEIPTSNIVSHISASHELVLGINLRGKDPQDTRKQRMLNKEMDALREQNQRLSEQTELLNQEIQKLKKELDKKADDESVSDEELEELKRELLEKLKEQAKIEAEKAIAGPGSKEAFEAMKAQLQNNSASKTGENTTSRSPATIQREVKSILGAKAVSASDVSQLFDEVKKVKMNDLENYNYHLVLGAYYNESDTRLYQEYLKNQNIPNTTITDDHRKMVYVVAMPENEIQQTIEVLSQKIRHGFLINGRPWVYIEKK